MKDKSTTIEIRQLAKQWCADSRRHDVCGTYPRETFEGIELSGDCGKGSGDDGAHELRPSGERFVVDSDPDHPWIRQTSGTHDGVDAARSGTIGDNQSSWLEVTVFGPGPDTQVASRRALMTAPMFVLGVAGVVGYFAVDAANRVVTAAAIELT